MTIRKPRAAAPPAKHQKCHEREAAFCWQLAGNPRTRV